MGLPPGSRAGQPPEAGALGFFGGSVETDFRVRSAPRRAPGAARGARGRHAEAGRLPVTRAGRPETAAAVSAFLSPAMRASSGHGGTPPIHLAAFSLYGWNSAWRDWPNASVVRPRVSVKLPAGSRRASN